MLIAIVAYMLVTDTYPVSAILASFALLVFATGFVFPRWQSTTAQNMLENWARRNRFLIIEIKSGAIRDSPFALTTTQNQDVFYIEVQDKWGAKRNGYARCGNSLLGVLIDTTEVIWND